MPNINVPIATCKDTNPGVVKPGNVVRAAPTPGRAASNSGFAWSNMRFWSVWQAPAKTSVASNASDRPFGVKRTAYPRGIGMLLSYIFYSIIKITTPRQNMTRKMTLAERLFDRTERITESGCWIWLGYTNSKGYGFIGHHHSTKEVMVHRASWEYFFGAVPDGLHVLHRCDVPSCVNPAHLFVGTNQDNVDDKMAKGRFKPMIGSKHGMAIFSDEQVLEIRRRYAAGER